MNERLIALYGKDALTYLSSQTVLVVGLGGVGGYAVEALARCGIGTIVLVDYDQISSSNINRQIIALTSTIGQDKTSCFKERIEKINPHCQVEIKTIKVDQENIETLFDRPISFVLDACDSKNAKIALAKICTEKQIPFLMALGAGNRKNPKEVMITTLDKTSTDPLARRMRTLFRKEKIPLKIPVVYSKEVPIKQENPIASSIFVPGTAGLLAAHYIITYFIEHKEKDAPTK